MLQDFVRYCDEYERQRGRRPRHEEEVREALEPDVAVVDHIRRLRVAAEATVLFVIDERCNDDLARQVRGQHPTLNILFQKFTKDPKLREALRDVDRWDKVHQHLQQVQLLGNTASHARRATLVAGHGDTLLHALQRAIEWSWFEAGIDDVPEVVALPPTEQPAPVEPAAPPSTVAPTQLGRAEHNGGLVFRLLARLVLAVVAVGLLLFVGLLAWQASGGLEAWQGERAMDQGAPGATRAVPNRRESQPRRSP